MSGTATAAKVAPQQRSSFDPHGILNDLEQKIRPVRTGPLYHLGLLLVTIAMLILPLEYVGLVLAVAYLVYLHAVNDVGILTGKGAARARLFAYVAPLIVGVVFVAFMAKPLFARRVRSQRPLSLNRSKEPLLFSYMDRLCSIVGAPRAKRIDVDCQVNASASFGEGLWSVLWGQLVLTIGLPLVGGLDVRQFTGVMAHELGHFSQGTAMRMTYIIRSVNAWFARVVYERDAWDQSLQEWAHSNEGWAMLIAVLIKLLVWLTRRILWLLMVAGHGISCFMLRQMEFDADRYEARVSGSSEFGRTSERVAMLSIGSQAAFSSLTDAWRERRLCDDLPMLISLRETEMPQNVRDEVRKMVNQRKTGLFDTHPADSDRIRSAVKENDPGIFHVSAPATALFADFGELAKDATMLFYMQVLGDEVKPEHVVPTGEIAQQVKQQQAGYEAARRFFQGLIHPARPVFPEPSGSADDESQSAEELPDLRTAMASAAASARTAADAYTKAAGQLAGVARVKAAQTSGVKLARAADYELPGIDAATLTNVTRSATATMADARRQLDEAIAPAMRRLHIALAIDRSRPVAEQSRSESYDVAADAPAGSVDRQLQALHCIRGAWPKVDALRKTITEMAEMLRNLKQEGNSQTQISAVLARTRQGRQHLVDLQRELGGTLYPYEHTERDATMARYAIRAIPGEQEVGGVYEACVGTIQSLYELYMRLMSDLAQRAEEIEKSLGLDPLAAPAENAGG